MSSSTRHPSEEEKNEIQVCAENKLWLYLFRIVVGTWIPVVLTASWWVVSKDSEQDQRLALIEQLGSSHSKEDDLRVDVTMKNMEKEDLRVRQDLLGQIDLVTAKIGERMDRMDDTIQGLPPADFRADYNEVKKLVMANSDALIKLTTKMDLMIDRWNAHMEQDAKRNEEAAKRGLGVNNP